jgi:hypothetical protein
VKRLGSRKHFQSAGAWRHDGCGQTKNQQKDASLRLFAVTLNRFEAHFQIIGRLQTCRLQSK